MPVLDCDIWIFPVSTTNSPDSILLASHAASIADCTQLTDMSIMEVASLEKLRHLYMAGLTRITDIAVEFLAEHASALTHLQISGCNRLSLGAVRQLFRRVKGLVRLGACIPAMARPGTKRFSEPTPSVSPCSARGPQLAAD